MDLQGKTSFISQDGILQLNNFIFVLAVMQIIYSVLTMALGRAKVCLVLICSLIVSQNTPLLAFPTFCEFCKCDIYDRLAHLKSSQKGGLHATPRGWGWPEWPPHWLQATPSQWQWGWLFPAHEGGYFIILV